MLQIPASSPAFRLAKPAISRPVRFTGQVPTADPHADTDTVSLSRFEGARQEHLRAILKNALLIPVPIALGYGALDATGLTELLAGLSPVLERVLGEGGGHAGLCYASHYVVNIVQHAWKAIALPASLADQAVLSGEPQPAMLLLLPRELKSLVKARHWLQRGGDQVKHWFGQIPSPVKKAAMIPVPPVLAYLTFDATGLTDSVAALSPLLERIMGEGMGHVGLCLSFHYAAEIARDAGKAVSSRLKAGKQGTGESITLNEAPDRSTGGEILKNILLIPIPAIAGYLTLDATGLTDLAAGASPAVERILGEGFGHAGFCYGLHYAARAGHLMWQKMTRPFTPKTVPATAQAIP